MDLGSGVWVPTGFTGRQSVHFSVHERHFWYEIVWMAFGMTGEDTLILIA